MQLLFQTEFLKDTIANRLQEYVRLLTRLLLLQLPKCPSTPTRRRRSTETGFTLHNLSTFPELRPGNSLRLTLEQRCFRTLFLLLLLQILLTLFLLLLLLLQILLLLYDAVLVTGTGLLNKRVLLEMKFMTSQMTSPPCQKTVQTRGTVHSVDKKFARLFHRFTVSRQAACIIAVTPLSLYIV